MAINEDLAPQGKEEVTIALQRALADLCRTRPPGDISVKEIAAAAGVTSGLVHYYYKTKNDLIAATLVMLADDLLAPISSNDPQVIATRFQDRLVDDPAFVRIVGWMIIGGHGDTISMERFPLVDRLRETMEPTAGREARIAAALTVLLGAALFAPALAAATQSPLPEVIAALRTTTGDLVS